MVFLHSIFAGFSVTNKQKLGLDVDLFHFGIEIRNGTPVFRSLLDLLFAVLVFAVFSWNVTPANSEGRLYKYLSNEWFTETVAQIVKLILFFRPMFPSVSSQHP